MLAMRSFLAGNVPPVVQSNFSLAANDFSTLSTLSSMPTGGSISRAGQAMLYDSTGKLTYAPNNVWLQNNTFATSPWYLGSGTALVSNTNNAASAPDGNNTAAVLVTGAGSATWTQNIASNGGNYIVSVWARVPSGTATMQLGLGGNSGSLSVTTTWQRFSFRQAAFSAGTQQVSVILVSANTAYELWGAQVEAVTYQTTPSSTSGYYLNYPTPNTTAAYYGPRFDYDPATLAAKGLLIEGTRTNIALYSQDFSNAYWSKSATITPTYNAFTSPDGTLNASRFASTTQFDSVSRSISSLTIGSAYTFSAWVRLVSGSSTLYLNIDEGGANVTRTSFTATSSWQRISVTRVITSGTATISVQNREVTASTFEVFGAQMELGSFATSYIPTVASSVARAAETFAITGYASNLIEAFYIDEATGGSWSANYNAGTAPSTSFGWTTSLRVYTNAYAGDIATPSWIDNSGTTGNRMYTDSTGALTWAPANWLTNSNTFSATGSWTNNNLATPVQGAASWDGTNTAWTITNDATNGLHRLYQGLAANSDGIRSVYAKAGTANFMSLSASGTDGPVVNLTDGSITNAPTGGTAYAVSVGNGWWRVSWRSSGNVGYIQIFIGETASQAIPNTSYAGTGKSILIASAQHEPVTYQTSPRAYIPTTTAAIYNPRYDYDASTVPATPRGMLIEESRTNLCTYSQQLDNIAWTQTSTTVTPDATVAPNGGQSYKVLTTVNTYSNTFNSAAITVVAGSVYTVSVYLKAGVGTGVQLRMTDTVTGQCLAQINPSTGSISVFSASVYGSVTVSSQSVGNGWYRYTMTGTQPAGQTTARVGLYLQNTNDYVYAWGFQLEAGSFVTSYIPTTTGAVTRVADVVKLSGSALTTFQGTNVTAITQYTQNPSFDASPAYQRMYVWDYLDGGTSRLSARASDLVGINPTLVIGSGTTVSTITPTTGATKGTTNRFAVAFSKTTSPAAVSFNGAAAVTGGTVFGGSVTSINIGGNNGGTNQFNSWLGSLAVYNQRLPDAILKQKSSVNAPY